MDIARITVHPGERWMQQIARNVTMEGCGALRDCRYLLHDRDTKYTQSFRAQEGSLLSHCRQAGTRQGHPYVLQTGKFESGQVFFPKQAPVDTTIRSTASVKHSGMS